MSFEEKIKNLTPAQMDALLEKVNDIKLIEKAEKALGLTEEELNDIEVEIE